MTGCKVLGLVNQPWVFSKPAALKAMFHMLWEDIFNWWNVGILYEGVFIRIRHTFNGAYLNSYITFIVNNTAGSMFRR